MSLGWSFVITKRASLPSKLRSNDFLSLCRIKAVVRSSYPERSEVDAISFRHQPSPLPQGSSLPTPVGLLNQLDFRKYVDQYIYAKDVRRDEIGWSHIVGCKFRCIKNETPLPPQGRQLIYQKLQSEHELVYDIFANHGGSVEPFWEHRY